MKALTRISLITALCVPAFGGSAFAFEYKFKDYTVSVGEPGYEVRNQNGDILQKKLWASGGTAFAALKPETVAIKDPSDKMKLCTELTIHGQELFMFVDHKVTFCENSITEKRVFVHLYKDSTAEYNGKILDHGKANPNDPKDHDKIYALLKTLVMDNPVSLLDSSVIDQRVAIKSAAPFSSPASTNVCVGSETNCSPIAKAEASPLMEKLETPAAPAPVQQIEDTLKP